MLHAKIINSNETELKLSDAENFLKSKKFGASIYFIGTVRDINENKNVTGITYDVKDSMVIKSFKEIYNDAKDVLGISNLAVFIEHIKGYVPLSEKGTIQEYTSSPATKSPFKPLSCIS